MVSPSVDNQTTVNAAVDDGTFIGNPRFPGIVTTAFLANEFAEMSEFYNQDIFGYVGPPDDFDSMWGYPNYFSTIMRVVQVFTPSALTYACMSFGKLLRPTPTANFNNAAVGIRWDFFNNRWECFVNNKWNAVPANRFHLIDLGADGRVGAVPPSVLTQHRLEIIYDPPISVTFMINGRTALVFTDALVAPLTPLAELYANKNMPGSTLAGLVLCMKQGAGVGDTTVMWHNTRAETLVRE